MTTLLAASTTVWLDQIVTGITRGGWIFLVAAGLTLVFGVLHVLNFAHGSLYLVGAYVGAALGPAFGGSLGAFLLILLIAPFAAAAVGGAIEVGLLRPTYRRPLLYQFLLMFGVVYVINGAVEAIWGVETRQLSAPHALTAPVHIGAVTIARYNLFTLAVGIVAAALVLLLLHRSAFGRDVRAVAQDPEMAALLGVRVGRVRTLVYVLGAWLAGLAGVITAGQSAFTTTDGVTTVILAFVVVIVGGMGSIWGAIVASLIIGVADAVGAIAIPDLSVAIVYLVMAVVLLVRPWGLLGRPVHA
ncbi:MAG TPA: branched-chain amino acid ABC transporter permease [Solirubrobacter sp.]|nr:branched-chain amino acid ABC transporter permease [Solirubrobacter sp.]